MPKNAVAGQHFAGILRKSIVSAGDCRGGLWLLLVSGGKSW
jgi:hypothetical protein